MFSVSPFQVIWMFNVVLGLVQTSLIVLDQAIFDFLCPISRSYGRIERFVPYPLGVEVKIKDKEGEQVYNFMSDHIENQKDVSKLQNIWNKIPSIGEIKRNSETKQIKDYLGKTDSRNHTI